MISEFMQLNQDEKARVITDMVETIAIETELPINICIQLVAEYKNYSAKRIEEYVIKTDSILLYQVAFYQNGNRVYKHQVDAEVKSCLKERLLKLIEQNPFEVNMVWLRKTIQEIATDL